MQNIVCFSGGHSSALAAIETVRRYGKENVVLLNHDISPNVEHEDIKRFKNDISNYLDIPITYANMPGWEMYDPLDICANAEVLGFAGKPAFKFGIYQYMCTYNLKSEPFKKWLSEYFPSKPFEPRKDVTIIYGFDEKEREGIQRRVGVMAGLGYKTDYPLALWKRTIQNTEEVGIKRPVTYEVYNHANCVGCLKAGKQQWYVTFCLRPDIWEKAKKAEEIIGYSILKDEFLEQVEPEFKAMRCKGIFPSEKMQYQAFWAAVKRILKEDSILPCECAI